MTREQAKQNLITIGIEEPTDEQVSNYLNQLNGESKRANARADKYKEDASKVLELQAQLDELQNANLTEVEKAQKETKDANDKISQLESQIRTMTLRNGLAEQGITGEDADALLNSINGGDFDVSILGQIISNREKTAVNNYQKMAMDGTPDPQGKKADDENGKTDAELLAESIGKRMAESNDSSSSIIDAYTK